MSSHSSELEHSEQDHHPAPRQYVFIAIVLAIVTAIEVGIVYVSMAEELLVGFLLALGFIKFWLVAAWFMHLKTDSRLFRRLFVLGIVLAIVVLSVAMISIFGRGGPAPVVTG